MVQNGGQAGRAICARDQSDWNGSSDQKGTSTKKELPKRSSNQFGLQPCPYGRLASRADPAPECGLTSHAGPVAGGLSPSRAYAETIAPDQTSATAESGWLSPNMRLPRPLGSAVGRAGTARWARAGRPLPQLSDTDLRRSEKFLRSVAGACFPKSAKGCQNLALRVQPSVRLVPGAPKGPLKEGRNCVVPLLQRGHVSAIADLLQLASPAGSSSSYPRGLPSEGACRRSFGFESKAGSSSTASAASRSGGAFG